MVFHTFETCRVILSFDKELNSSENKKKRNDHSKWREKEEEVAVITEGKDDLPRSFTLCSVQCAFSLLFIVIEMSSDLFHSMQSLLLFFIV